MSNPTSNFNWQMPTPTDLVTDLPADFEVFGQAVDSSMADLLGGTTGQILAKNSNTNMDFVWITNDVGDITAVNAGTGISGGGTSGAVTITNSMATEIAAKGDLIAGTGSQTFDNLGVGANNTVLTADSSTATGLKWAAPASAGGMTLLSTTTMSGSSTTVSSISQDYVNLYVVLENVTVSLDAEVSFRIQSNSSLHFQYYLSAGSATVGTVVGGSGTLTGGATMDDVGTGGMGNWSMTFNNYSQGKRFGYSGQGIFYKPSWCAYWFGGGFESNTAMSQLQIVASNSATLGGTIKIYGVK